MVYVVDLTRTNDIDDTEVISLLNPDVWSILISWENKCSFALDQEKHFIDILIVKEEELVLSVDLRFEKWAHPKNETYIHICKELDLDVSLLIDVERYFCSDLVWKLC